MSAVFLCFSAMLQATPTLFHDFGSVSVTSTPASFAFNAVVAGAASAPLWSVSNTLFSVTAVACNVSSGSASCSGTISFAPLAPGLQTGALLAKDSSGNLLASYPLKGIGTAPQLLFSPGTITTFAGSGTWGYADGTLAGSAFRNPSGVAVDQTGNLYIADSINQVVRKITSTTVSTIAGNGMPSYSGDGGQAVAAGLNNPTGIAVDSANNIFIADQGNNLIRRVDGISGVISTVAGGGSTPVTAAAANLPARYASLLGPQSIAVDPTGNLFISDSFHNMVLQVDPSTGYITLFAGGGTNIGSDGYGDGGAATSAGLNNPTGLAFDSAGNLFIADTNNNLIRVVNAATGIISVVAGNGSYGYAGDGGLAVNASFASPMAVRVDAAGDLYIADFANSVIRQTSAATGVISTIAGTGTSGYSGDGGLSTNARLATPTDLALTSTGNLFVVDNGNNVIRQLPLSLTAVNFPNAIVGTVTSTQTLMLLNSGNQPMSVTGLTLSSPFRSIAGNCTAGSVLPVGGTCYLDLEFSPIAAGSVSTNLSFADNSLNVSGTTLVPLSGIGIVGNAPTASLSTTNLNFGTVSSGSTPTQTITLSNQGTAPLAVGGISVGGSSAFSISTTCGSSIPAGSNCTISVTFAPVAGVTYSGLVTIADSAGTSPQQVTLAGVASGGPVGSLGSSSVFFSSVLSSGSVAQTVSLTNTGTGSLNVAGISITGANAVDFNVSSRCGSALSAGQSCSTSIAFSPAGSGLRNALLTIADNGAGSPHILQLSGAGPSTPLQFMPVAPCRILDTRLANGPFGGPVLAPFVARTFVIPNSVCQIPANAAAYSINITAVPSGPLGALATWPAGLSQPLVSTLNSDGRVKANAAIVPAGVAGGIQLSVSQPSHVVVDINGYFVAGSSSALDFFPVTPCRIADTRFSTGAFGPPFMGAQTTRTFPVLSSPCNIPSSAQAYSLNFTVVPHVPLSYITVWPTGQTQPLVSTLNAPTGATTANAAIVPAGTGGSINVLATNDTDLIIDIDGYFAPPNNAGLSLYNLTPCRVLDTRQANGAFTGTLTVNVSGSACSPPSTAKSYVLNATVVPVQPLGALTLWATGTPLPLASTLNSVDGVIMSNLAFVPDTNGSISASASNPSQLILDISGYFAP